MAEARGRLQGKVAIVTGAGSGIGRAVAIAFCREGARVVVNDRRTDGMGPETVALALAAAAEAGGSCGGRADAPVGGEAVYVAADVSVEADVQQLIDITVATFGRLDVMVNNAGVSLYKPLQELTEADFDLVIAVNQKGVFFGTKHAVAPMIASGGGSIINTASIAAEHGHRGGMVYSATKGAVLSMTRTAATELAPHNIRVNAVQPGVISTGMRSAGGAARARMLEHVAQETPLGNRIGLPEDVAPFYIFLAADESRFVTGQRLIIDGGILAASHII